MSSLLDFASLFDEYYPKLYAYVRSQVDDQQTAEDITATDDDGYLNARAAGRGYFGGNSLNDSRLDAVIQFSHQRFTAEFQQYASVWNRTVTHTLPSRSESPLILA